MTFKQDHGSLPGEHVGESAVQHGRHADRGSVKFSGELAAELEIAVAARSDPAVVGRIVRRDEPCHASLDRGREEGPLGVDDDRTGTADRGYNGVDAGQCCGEAGPICVGGLVNRHPIFTAEQSFGCSTPGPCQDPDQGVASEEFTNDALAEVAGGSGNEDGFCSDDVLFSVGYRGLCRDVRR